ncbi:MAG: efflux RND transporter periplasmic adaptor subunit [Nevskia sp.]|nr:efflux RND transporter periplasmic adaptor subunit [Nevskia sp.]
MRTSRFVLIVLVASLAPLGWLLFLHHSAVPETIAQTVPPAQAPAAAQGKPLYWYDPMKPEVHFNQPGRSPYMDMALLPKYADRDAAAGAAASVVSIDPRMQQNLGMRTAPVVRAAFAGGLNAVGEVQVDERRIVAVASRVPGWVESLAVRAVGDPVRRGQTLAGIYAPDLLAAQQELALAHRTGDAQLAAAAGQRLRLLGATGTAVKDIAAGGAAQQRTAVVAPADGVVIELNVREGQQAMPGEPLMKLADLSQVWITVEVPEALAAGVRAGQAAKARLAALPGREFDGVVELVYPQLDGGTRTVRARITFANTDGALKPGMYADVYLAGSRGAQAASALLVPSEAVIRTGRRTVVIVADGGGRFHPAAVTMGAEHGGRIEILAGLGEGQQVVTSGQFLIDSEASLSGAYERMQAAPGAGP